MSSPLPDCLDAELAHVFDSPSPSPVPVPRPPSPLPFSHLPPFVLTMAISTRSKTGASLPPARPISKRRATAAASASAAAAAATSTSTSTTSAPAATASPAAAPAKKSSSRAPPAGPKSSTSAKASSARPVAVAVGDALPADVSLSSHTGASLVLSTLFTEDAPGLVLFTYPRANTPGCTTQALALREAVPRLQASGYRVVGVSYDKPKGQAAWRAKHELGFTLLTDTPEVGLIRKLGAHKAPKGIKRSVFVVVEGVIRVAVVGVSPRDTVPAVMEYVKEHPCGKGGEGVKEEEREKGEEVEHERKKAGGEEEGEALVDEVVDEEGEEGGKMEDAEKDQEGAKEDGEKEGAEEQGK